MKEVKFFKKSKFIENILKTVFHKKSFEKYENLKMFLGIFIVINVNESVYDIKILKNVSWNFLCKKS